MHWLACSITNEDIKIGEKQYFLPNNWYDTWLQRMPADRIKKCESYKNVEQRECCVAAFVLLSELLKINYGISYEDIKFEYNIYGKPMFSNIKDIYFNISHSSGIVACVVSERECGIDVQQQNAINEFTEKAAKRVLSKQSFIEIFDEKDREKRQKIFAEKWAEQECYCKLLGTGIRSYNEIENAMANVKENIKIEKVIARKVNIFVASYTNKIG